MNNPLIEEIRSARAARAESLDYDPRKIAEWARAAHAQRQKMLKSKIPNKTRIATAGKPSDEVEQQAAAPSL
jgi:hypothetical protein